MNHVESTTLFLDSRLVLAGQVVVLVRASA